MIIDELVILMAENILMQFRTRSAILRTIIGSARKDFKVYTDVTMLTWRKIVIIK